MRTPLSIVRTPHRKETRLATSAQSSESMASHTACVLRGQKLLIVGGDRREGALRRLFEAFDFADVIHCPTRKADSSARCFASHVRRSEVVLVVWVTGLSRTHHGTQLHNLCRSLRIPWIACFRIPHPNALAARITECRLFGAIRARREQLVGIKSAGSPRIGGAA